ncbi:hypothetical protein ACSETL_34770 [Pseudomonas aeruginosa]
MERLFRKGYEPALTLGNAKAIDILVCNPETKKTMAVSVKAVRGGGKWGVGRDDLSSHKDLVFVFLLYTDFDDLIVNPDVWVMRAKDVETRKAGWLNQAFAIYYSGANAPHDLDRFKDAWHLI